MENELMRILAERCCRGILGLLKDGHSPDFSALLADYDALKHENDELRRKNEELRQQVEELSKLAAQMSEGDKACAFLTSLPSMATNDAELKAKIDEAFYTIQGDPRVWRGLHDLPHEIWSDIVGYEGLYQISNMGRTKSLKSGEKIIVGQFSRSAEYWSHKLLLNGGCKSRLTHRLVAEAFIPNPDGKSFVNHKNGVKTDNRVVNLEWATPRENVLHAYRNGFCRGGRLTDEQVRYVRENPDGLTRNELADMFEMTASAISLIRHHKNYRHVK